MWGIDPTDQSHEPGISIRPSQNKIKLLTPLHRSHLILDLVSPSRVSMPSRLSMQTITCLAHNGVPDSAFKALIEKELDAIIQPLTDWDNPSSMLTVAKAIERAGHITGARLSRFAGGSTKALGLGKDFHRDEDDSDQYDDGDIFNNKTVSGRESFSEAPRSVFESAYELVIAGFHPLKLRLLYDKIQKIVTYVIDNFVKNLHIPVSESVEAFIIPGRVLSNLTRVKLIHLTNRSEGGVERRSDLFLLLAELKNRIRCYFPCRHGTCYRKSENLAMCLT